MGCMLTGWNSKVLSECSEASRSHLSKYTSALLILIMIWGVTGFCFAQRYIGFPIVGCILVSLFFITIVIMIERQIILTLGKSFSMLAFRAVIAFIMAIVGSTIFDQTMFGKDIDKQMANNIEIQVADLSAQRVHTIDDKLAMLRIEIDSLDKVNSLLQADINQHPFIKQTSVTTTQDKKVMPDGTIQTVSIPTVTSNQVANPKQSVVDANAKTIAMLREQELEWTDKNKVQRRISVRNVKRMSAFLKNLKLCGLSYQLVV